MTYPATGSIASAMEIPSLMWTSPQGVEYTLNLPALDAYGYLATAGVTGFGIAPITIATDPHPRGGVRVRHIQPQPRMITLPLYIEGSSEIEFRTRWRALAQAFAETRRLGPGLVTVLRPDGTRRLIEAYYQDGWDVNPGMGAMRDVVALTLMCPDPFWRDLEPTLAANAYAPAAGDFLDPLPTISSAQTLGETTVHNPGGVEAWPTWTVTGPASQITATNLTTEESWTLDPVAFDGGPITAGQTITVTTDPPTVTGPDGSDWTGAMNWPAAVLWPLDPGTNDVEFLVSGSSSGTSMSAEFYARYETA